MLGDQGADTPALAIYGGVLTLAIYIVVARCRARKNMTAADQGSAE